MLELLSEYVNQDHVRDASTDTSTVVQEMWRPDGAYANYRPGPERIEAQPKAQLASKKARPALDAPSKSTKK